MTDDATQPDSTHPEGNGPASTEPASTDSGSGKQDPTGVEGANPALDDTGAL